MTNPRFKQLIEGQMDAAQEARTEHATTAQAPLSCMVCTTPVRVKGVFIPVPRFHVFRCPPEEARGRAHSEAASYAQAPEGFEYLDEAEEWAGGKAVERSRFYFGGRK